MGEAVASLPPDAHPQVALAVIKEKYDLEHVFYLDLWPVSYPLMAIHDPGVAAQICQIHSLPKHSLVKQYLRNVAGIRSIVTEEERDWKLLRQILSPGFAPQQIMAMVPTMLKHINVFKAKLQHFAGTGESFPMQELASWATIDVIGEVVLGKNFDSQTDPKGIPENFRRTIPWMGSSFNVLKNAVASILIWWYTSLLDKDIKTSILERHAGHVGDTTIQKTTVDLALKAYRDEKLGAASLDSTKLEPEFVTIAVNNIKTLRLGIYLISHFSCSGLLTRSPRWTRDHGNHPLVRVLPAVNASRSSRRGPRRTRLRLWKWRSLKYDRVRSKAHEPARHDHSGT